ncbi:MAG TPA: pyridoxamine 5'-phosphate oxidase [Verrucomicrobiae bacterium]
MSFSELRREYSLTGLRRADLEPDPLTQFRKWFDQATGARAGGRVRRLFVRWYKRLFLAAGAVQVDLNAMTLATVDPQGRPSTRVVLLKALDERGFVFYTNYSSRKGMELAGNPHAALTIYWADQERQVCVAGTADRVSGAESDAYFKSRPQRSRIAAWASDQSQVIADRAELEGKWRQYDAKYPGENVPRPPYWGGYVLVPERVEFWQGRPNRLHDRFRYTRQPNNSWLIERLSP